MPPSFDDDEPTHALEDATTHISEAGLLGGAPTRAATSAPQGRSGTVLLAASVSPVRVAEEPLRALRAFGDRYAHGRLLGEGGMGEVRLAHDEVVGRDVAVKTLRPAIAREGEGRFLREARVQGQLEHPTVVPVYDVGATEDGRLFFTMKRVRGDALDALLERIADGDDDVAQRFPTRRLLSAFAQLCLAVEYAHSRGVLHRDLKPGNVMLGAFGEVHLLDWGLAKVTGQAEPRPGAARPILASASGDHATLDGAVLGTPGYMAPEQAMGELDALDERTDVYALGAILYEIVALESLHRGLTAEGRIASTLRGPDPPIDARPSAANVPPELLDLVRRATALRREDRIPTARELGAAVERWLDGERDELRRRELARGHLDRARALAADAGRHLDALREIGRALALDPTDGGALELLQRLLADVPDAVPPAARATLDELDRERVASMLRVARVRAYAWVAAAPLYILMGVTSWARMAVALGLVLANAALAFAVRAERRTDAAAVYGSLGLSTACVATQSFLFGPLFLAPVFAITNAMTYALAGDRRLRATAIAVSIAAFALPLAASLAGLEPTYYAVEGGALVVRSSMITIAHGPTIAILVASLAATTVSPSLMVGRYSERLAAAEKRIALQAWHLRQIFTR
jgi:serine/threonine-protein kinase